MIWPDKHTGERWECRGRVRCCWAASCNTGSGTDGTVAWDKNATCKNNWIVLWNTDLKAWRLKPERPGPHSDFPIWEIHNSGSQHRHLPKVSETDVNLQGKAKGYIRYTLRLLHFNPLLPCHHSIHKCFALRKLQMSLRFHRHPGGNSSTGLNNLLGQARLEAGEKRFLKQNKHHEQWKPT